MNVEETVRAMIASLEETVEDAVKADKGNKSAGTRVRKTLQGIRTSAADLRKKVIEVQKAASTE